MCVRFIGTPPPSPGVGMLTQHVVKRISIRGAADPAAERPGPKPGNAGYLRSSLTQGGCDGRCLPSHGGEKLEPLLDLHQGRAAPLRGREVEVWKLAELVPE